MNMATRSSRCATLAALVSLAAFAASAVADESQVEKCSKSFGAIAVAEPQSGWGHIQRYGLGSPAALLRMMIQQSGCFDVVERGIAMRNLQQERALGQSGELRQESNLGKGQMQAADFVMTPDVQIPAQTTGGVGGALLVGDLTLAHAVANHLAAPEFHLLAVGAEVLLDLDDEIGIGEPHAIAGRGAEHVGIDSA